MNELLRRRCVSPDNRPGGWGSALDAMREAVEIATGKRGLEWAQVSALWQGMKEQGWRLESERARPGGTT